ncbi:amidase [Dactylosporangium sp. NPDC048998]|uniref:amidase n=1 Tax=Dactylosporangium sp. NPDC048998 TaxID=3363976 RepID=UPI00371A245A
MTTEKIVWMSGHEMARAIRAKELSSVEAVTAVLEQLEKVEPRINAFVTVTAEQALEQARLADARTVAGDELPKLHGVPITVKDLTATAGVRTCYGTDAFRDHVPDTDDVDWARLRAAGAILIGKTTTPPFGMLGITDSPVTGRTSTPWAAPTHTSGGSSGGAAASVASGVAPFAWGSDGGGSIRVPAACCGVVGLKTTPNRIPGGSGESPWNTTAVVGPLTRTVRDAALLLDVTAGPHPALPLSLPLTGESYEAATINATLQGLRIAFSPDFGSAEVDREVLAIVTAAVGTFESLGGARVDEVSMSIPDPIQYFGDVYGPSFAAALEMDTPAGKLRDTGVHPAIEYIAQKGREMTALESYFTENVTRTRILRGFLEVLGAYDLLVSPTMPVAAFPHPGPEAGNTHVNGKPVREPMLDFHRLTESPTHAMLPAISVNCGFTVDGLPVGLQIIGPPLADAAVLAAAAAFESVTDWGNRRPPIA